MGVNTLGWGKDLCSLIRVRGVVVDVALWADVQGDAVLLDVDTGGPAVDNQAQGCWDCDRGRAFLGGSLPGEVPEHAGGVHCPEGLGVLGSGVALVLGQCGGCAMGGDCLQLVGACLRLGGLVVEGGVEAVWLGPANAIGLEEVADLAGCPMLGGLVLGHPLRLLAGGGRLGRLLGRHGDVWADFSAGLGTKQDLAIFVCENFVKNTPVCGNRAFAVALDVAYFPSTSPSPPYSQESCLPNAGRLLDSREISPAWSLQA